MGGYLLPSDGDLDSDVRYDVRTLLDGVWKGNELIEGERKGESCRSKEMGKCKHKEKEHCGRSRM